MLDAWHGSPLEGAGKGVGNITAVGQEMQPTLAALQGLKDRCKLSALCGLKSTQNWSVIEVPLADKQVPIRHEVHQW